jgi:hypothetical protein
MTIQVQTDRVIHNFISWELSVSECTCGAAGLKGVKTAATKAANVEIRYLRPGDLETIDIRIYLGFWVLWNFRLD